MTQEDKELLLKDLSARLSYGVKVRTNRGSEIIEGLAPFCHNKVKIALNLDWSMSIDGFTPYLRPMSSMTEEEFESLKQYSGLIYDQLDLAEFQDGTYKCLDFYLSEVPSYVVILVFDWLNRHHFDYRGLIEKGLALEAPEGVYE